MTLQTFKSRFGSKAELFDALNRYDGYSYCLGQSAEAPQDYFALRIRLDAGEILLGIMSETTGLSPKCVVSNELLFVGFNHQIAVFGVGTGSPTLDRVLDLLSLFVDFVDLPPLATLCVVAESAVIGLFRQTGDCAWRVDTDLITNYEHRNNMLRLRLADSPDCAIDLESGRLTQATP